MQQVKFRLSDAELERVVRAMPEGESVPGFARRTLLERVDDEGGAQVPTQIPGQIALLNAGDGLGVRERTVCGASQLSDVASAHRPNCKCAVCKPPKGGK